MMLHKFRRAMNNLTREPLRGEVEVDETWVGGTQAGLQGSRQLKGRKAALVLVAVEKRGRATGRARMAVITDFKSETLIAFLKQNVEPGATVYTDGLKSFSGLEEAGYHHVARTQPLRIELRKGANSVVPLADRAIGNLQQWLIGTYHGVSRDQLQLYLDEFVFRHNRRRLPMARPCSASQLRAILQLMSRSAGPPIFAPLPTTSYCVKLLRVAETTG
jgi:transposase-like protein